MIPTAFRTVAAAATLLGLLAAAPAQAGLVGASYTASITGNTVTGPFATQQYTDPVNPGFCVGPNMTGCQFDGMSAGFGFEDVSATQAIIRFSFFGSTGTNAQSFMVNLSNFVTTNGATITGISARTNTDPFFFGGNFDLESWDGHTASFKATPDRFNEYTTIENATAVFNVTFAAPQPEPENDVPEPSSAVLVAAALAGLGLLRRRAPRHTGTAG